MPLSIWDRAFMARSLAAHLGLPYAFASHFAPDMLDDALHIYRRDFKPSAQLQQPYAMAGFNIFAADSQEEAENIATSMMQAVVALHTGTPGRLQPPKPGYRDTLPPMAQAMLDNFLAASSIGTQAVVERDLAAFIRRTRVDEIMVGGHISIRQRASDRSKSA